MAPASRAVRMLESSAKVVRTTTLTVGSSTANRCVAVTPSTLGMRRSISTTSGENLCAEFDRFVAVSGQADHLKTGFDIEDGCQGFAHGPLVIGDHNPKGCPVVLHVASCPLRCW